MTNGEKFKTTEERSKKFKEFCESFTCDKCPITEKGNLTAKCAFKWLDLEYKEKLLPCPFCGSEASMISCTDDHYVICCNSDCAAALVARGFPSPEETIAAWNRRAK